MKMSQATRKSLFSTKENKTTAGLCGAIINKKSTGDKGEPSKTPEVIALKDEDESGTQSHQQEAAIPSTSLRKWPPGASSSSLTPLQPSLTSPKSKTSPLSAAATSPSRHFKPKTVGHPDADVIEIINLYSPPSSPKAASRLLHDETDGSGANLSTASKRCQFKEEVEVNPVVQDNYLSQLRDKYVVRKQEADRRIVEEKIRDRHNSIRVGKMQKNVEERLRQHLKISDVAVEEPPPLESSESEEEEEEEVEEGLPDITDEMEDVINHACNSRGETLIKAYQIDISRKDIDTLKVLNWLNDEVINFYMNMIVKRSKENDNWPTVYATNTFFYPKIMATRSLGCEEVDAKS